eukprot:scaffold61176_cov65-Phaeocystis_antarctica.AAC.3
MWHAHVHVRVHVHSPGAVRGVRRAARRWHRRRTIPSGSAMRSAKGRVLGPRRVRPPHRSLCGPCSSSDLFTTLLTYLRTCAEVDGDVEQEEDVEAGRDVVEGVGGGLAEVLLKPSLQRQQDGDVHDGQQQQHVPARSEAALGVEGPPQHEPLQRAQPAAAGELHERCAGEGRAQRRVVAQRGVREAIPGACERQDLVRGVSTPFLKGGRLGAAAARLGLVQGLLLAYTLHHGLESVVLSQQLRHLLATLHLLVPAWSTAVESAALEAASSSTRGSGWAPSGSASSWESRAAQSRQARPEEAQEPSWGTAKGAL